MRPPTTIRDSYRRRLRTQVLACRSRGDGYIAITPDTIVYPGGGGQPADHAMMGGQPVLGVENDGDRGWIHVLAAPIPSGPVVIELDWERRFDHMQQHSAQHLVTALAQDQYGMATVAFHLGAERSSIDLDTTELGADVLAELEALVDAEIRAALPVAVTWLERDAIDERMVRSRGLPDDHRGQVRVVTIEGVDRNTCGGTHVANTAELQVVRFLGLESVHGGQTRLHYVAGQRALTLFGSTLARERGLTSLLAAAPDEHADAVKRLLGRQRTQTKELRQLRDELAEMLGRGLALAGEGGLATLHREQADLAFLHAVAASARAAAPQILFFLTCGELSGSFLLAGPAKTVAGAGPELAALLDGRGGGVGGRYQGRADRIDLREEAVRQLRASLADESP